MSVRRSVLVALRVPGAAPHGGDGGTLFGELAKLWRFREVVYVLIGRELKARYRGASLGFLWSIVNPIIFMSVYVLVFSVYMRIPVPNYPAFVLCGLLPWNWFAASVTESSRSILDNRGLVKRVALPSEIFPFVSIGANLIHFLLSMPLLLALLVLLGVELAWTAVLFPVILMIQFVITFGIALICSSLSVRFRDLLQLVPSLLTLWFFVTPVFYPASLVPPAFRGLLRLNPMAWLIDAYHQVLLYQRTPPLVEIGILALVGLALVAAGQLVFDARRESFVEEI